jgi:DMSO/TMAO reductase YedYZ heme-binding membrane subunit
MSKLWQGWPLVGVASAALLALQLAVVASGGTDEAGLRLLVRVSARASFAIFLLVFVARPARFFWPGAFTRWLMRNRRQLGVSFAIAHFLHLGDIALLALLLGDGFELQPVTLYGGGLAYVLLAAMTATSFDRSARWLGPRRWKLLHRAGLYWLWFIFAQSYTFGALEKPGSVPFALAVWGALALRIAAWRARRASAAAPAAPATAA